jgi:hypothetical protein
LAITVSSVIIDDLDVVGIPTGPAEADPPLVVDPDAVLAVPISCQCFETIARRGLEVVEGAGPMKIA